VSTIEDDLPAGARVAYIKRVLFLGFPSLFFFAFVCFSPTGQEFSTTLRFVSTLLITLIPSTPLLHPAPSSQHSYSPSTRASLSSSLRVFTRHLWNKSHASHTQWNTSCVSCRSPWTLVSL